MARIFISVSLSLLVAFASCRSTYHLAPRVEQTLEDRATYLGGWPLAAVPCPADASVVCSTGIESQINQQCCPSGNTCFSWPSTFPVCCPTAQNCIGQLQNLPVCANSSWNMFNLGGNNYFCCEQGQVGVIPLTGYAGICQAGSQGVAASLLATMVNQVGGTSATSFSSVPTAAASGGTVTNPLSSTTATATVTSTGSSSSGGSSPSSPSSSNTASNSSSSVQLGSGAIAGIAIGGAIVIAALIFVLWKSCSRKPQVQHYASPSGPTRVTYDPAAERSFQSGSPPIHEYKASPVYPQVRRIHEVSGENGLVERAEMEN